MDTKLLEEILAELKLSNQRTEARDKDLKKTFDTIIPALARMLAVLGISLPEPEQENGN